MKIASKRFLSSLNVAGPVVAKQIFKDFIGEPFYLTSENLIECAQVMFEQSRNILLTLSQRREMNPGNTESVIQILADFTVCHPRFDILICSRNNTDVKGNTPPAP